MVIYGGDDFVAITSSEQVEQICIKITKEFDKRIVEYYNEEDIKKGSIKILNRKGKLEKYPIMTITVAMISNRYRRYESTLEIGEEGASVKKKAKTIPGSTFLEDRRRK